jgi:lipoyl(octanoyl) transferase
LQRQLTAEGRVGWLLFSCPPTITLGKRGHFSDVLMPIDELRRRGVRLAPVDRGGQVTYHGPGQILGFPLGTIEDHVGDPRGVRRFVCDLTRRLEAFVEEQGHRVARRDADGNAGVWIEDVPPRKIVSIGMGFGREGIRHGFALNVDSRVEEGFGLVNACGEVGPRPAWLGIDFDAARAGLEVHLSAR